MARGPMGPRLRAGALCSVLLQALVPAAVGVVAATVPSAEADAYSRPAPRTPSSGLGSVQRRPSFGGYRRPALPGQSERRPSFGIVSPGDQSIGSRRSAQALEEYRSARRPSPPTAATAPPATERTPSWGGERSQLPWYAYQSPRRFGAWDALFLWTMLQTLSEPGHAAFFHHHQDDPGYRRWREDAERRAADDPRLRAQLDRLDSDLAAMSERPRDPSYLPPDVSPDEASADGRAPPEPGGPGRVVIPVVVGGGVLVLLWRARRRRKTVPASVAPASVAPAGAARFRVGMTLTMDPTPFLLAADITKVRIPETAAEGLLVSVAAVGTVGDGVTLHRLYLPEGMGFVQLHLDADGRPDECRYFSPIDEVRPPNAEEWAFWLDDRDGMIGWPRFQTTDGRIYDRVWAPGDMRIPPERFVETIEDLAGRRTVTSEAMLYGAPTGAPSPAPPIEYILVALVEGDEQAVIRIHAGIDVNPAGLSLG